MERLYKETRIASCMHLEARTRFNEECGFGIGITGVCCCTGKAFFVTVDRDQPFGYNQTGTKISTTGVTQANQQLSVVLIPHIDAMENRKQT